MVACNEANDLPPDTELSHGLWQMPLDLNEHTKNIIKLYDDPDTREHAFIKRQCMHCIDPACVGACMLGALQKREHGIVTYDASLCIGCRYCEIGCPFNVPKFEWEKASPKIVKCELCSHRIAKGKGPACCEVCPVGAVIYGKHSDLLDEAHRRLDEHPERYVPKVYGEHDAGGTQVLYLAHVDFEKLGLPNCGDRSVPSRVRTLQHAIYKGFAAPLALYGLLAGVLLRNRKKSGPEAEEDTP
jgi:Fe-S-cluster-containing dehydrogenase component